MRRWSALAVEPVDAASIGAFRVLFGACLLIEAGRWLAYGWIDAYFLAPSFLFKYYGFEWVAPLPGAGLHLLTIALAGLAALVAFGVWYRAAIAGLFLAFAYLFLLDQGTYLNQYYLLLVLALLMCAIPADREYTLRGRSRPPPVVPRWAVWVLRLQFELVLLFAGLVKLNADWLAGQPLGLWLGRLAAGMPVASAWLVAPGVDVAISYGVILLHLVGAPMLLWRRTRLAAFAVYTLFHVLNATLLDIGIFPWLTLAGTLLFFDPSWPREVARRLGLPERSAAPAAAGGSAADSRLGSWTLGFFVVFFLVQVLAPLRFLLYPGNVAWTQQGLWFAWRMKLDDRRGTARFIVTDPSTGRSWDVQPGEYLGARQVELLATNPDMILQFARHLERQWRRTEGVQDVEVRAIVMCSLNGRAAAPLVDPRRDLTTVARTWRHYDWILPLETPLPTSSADRP